MDQSSNERIKLETAQITRAVIVNVLGLSMAREELQDDVDVFDLGMDSLSVVSLVVALEEELGVQISAEEMSAELFHRLGDLTAYLARLRLETATA